MERYLFKIWILIIQMGTAVAQFLLCYATNRNVTGSITDGVIGILL